MITYSTTEARAILGDIVNQVKYQKKIIAIGRNKKAEAYIIPIPEEQDLPISDINANSSSFNFLKDEPDLYSLNDLKKQYV